MPSNGNAERPDIRVLIFRGRRKWVAQCLEFDIAVQADALEDLEGKFRAALAGEEQYCRERGLTPLTRLPQAPQRYIDTWDALQGVSHEGQPWSGIPPYVASAQTAVAIETAK